MQPLGKTRSRRWENAGARQYHRDRTHERRGGLGGSSRKTIGSLVVRADKTWYHSHPTTRVTLRSLESRIEGRALSQTPCGRLPKHITRGARRRPIPVELSATRKLARLVPRSRPADINFYACSSRRRIRLQANVIIDRIVKTLLAPEVSLRRLN